MPPRKTKRPIVVDAIRHEDKRANLPTADAHDFVGPELEQPNPVRYPRDASLDPQLVWKGKDALDGEDLLADAPPIYIQEKINSRVLVENLRRTAERPEDEPELSLFESFDGLSDLDLVEFYEHEANWSNRMILGDSLNVMASLAEREVLRGKVQMIYLDPPYGIKFGSNWQVSARKREVKDGKLADATREVEQIRAFRDTWELGIHSYLSYLRDRLTASKELLTESGSVFVQIGDENMHLVRALMDEVFGSDNFCAVITLTKAASQSADLLASVNDFVMWYARDKSRVKYRQLYKNRAQVENPKERYICVQRPTGQVIDLSLKQKLGEAPIPEGEFLRLVPLNSQTGSDTSRFDYEFEGKAYRPPGARGWSTNEEGLRRVEDAGRMFAVGTTLMWKHFHSDFPYRPLVSLWDDIRSSGFGDKKVYVVQTQVGVIERCVLMSTDPGDLVLDPTCGSGTTAFVAEQWGRRWITIDTSRVALAIARQRLMMAQFPYYLLADSDAGRRKQSELVGQPLPASETRDDIRHGFVYERVPNIRMGAIARNPDVRPGMDRAEAERVIRKHADVESFYDRPYVDGQRVRVTGPFSVESLSPHRSLAFAGSAVDETGAVNAEEMADASHGDASFEQTILANLRAAGIQNGRKGERLEFASVDAYAGTYIQAIAARDDAESGTPAHVGITIGPQYGTVGPSFIKDAAREANRAADLDLLCVLGFAFDPAVMGASDDYVASEDGFANVAAERQLGRVPVLLVRMNADLVMGEELKKTGAGNLFTVFGEPDLQVESDGEELRVVLHGVDVYDPNTGEIRSDETDSVALWMIDTAYNGESFFVRHCYFTGGQNPYARLKRVLQTDIDEAAWASLNATESRPFARPESGRIAVKVINDYGDEVMKVFAV